jgi:hypothetical protein
LSYCENLSWGGFSDWRLPNIKELLSINDYKKRWPFIDADAFPSNSEGSFWSATSWTKDPTFVFFIEFNEGEQNAMAKVDYAKTRCIRDY